MSFDSKAPDPGLTASLAWNLIGESLPVLAAVVAIPILLHRLGTDRFGVLTLSWMVAGYFGLFDFGLGRALTKAMAQEFGLGRERSAATLFWTSLAMMLILGALAGTALAMIAPWLTERALKIPLALQRETLAGFYVVAVGLPMLITASALRAALAAANRFDLLNLIRTPSGMLSFAAPALMLPFTHSLAWLIAALIANRAVSWVAYLAAILSALPALRTNRRIELACMRPLIGFGAWITVSNLIIPIMVYLDRFMIGGLLSMAALTAYSIPMEIAGKTVVVPAAISGVMFPAFARSFAVAPAESRRLFERSLKLLGLIMFPVCAMIVTFAPQIMSLWIGRRSMLGSSVVVLQILAIGAFVTSVAWIPLALLHGAHRPDLPAKLHLFDFSIYALLLWICVRRFGVTGAAFTWSGRLLVENLVMFAMASRLITASRREVMGGCASQALAIAVIALGAFLSDIETKAVFLCALAGTTSFVGWRFLLSPIERSRIIGFFSPALRPVLERAERSANALLRRGLRETNGGLDELAKVVGRYSRNGQI